MCGSKKTKKDDLKDFADRMAQIRRDLAGLPFPPAATCDLPRSIDLMRHELRLLQTMDQEIEAIEEKFRDR
jgi:hypothetical protein